MVRTYESNGKIECEVVYGQDSNSNALNIFWLVPQYVIITMSEVSSTKPKSILQTFIPTVLTQTQF